MIENLDSTVALDTKCSTCRKSKSEPLSYGCGESSPKTLGEVLHTDIQEPFPPTLNGMRYVLVFVEERSRDKQIVALKARDAAVEAAGHYVDQTLREGVTVKLTYGDGAGGLWRSGKFLKMLAEGWFAGVPLPQDHLKATASEKKLSRRS